MADALEKLIECLSVAAVGVQRLAEAIEKQINTPIVSQPWFDHECAYSRSQTFKAVHSFRNTGSSQSLAVYQNIKKKYRNLINEKKKDEHKRKQTLKLEQACDNKNPKEFWRFLKSSKNSPSAYISTNDWYNYFSNLVNPIIKSENEEAITVTDELLDAPITFSEIRHSIMNLKSGKSPGIDGIPAEFFKVACDKFLPFLEILFNIFYNTAFFPEDWSMSVITPIPK